MLAIIPDKKLDGKSHDYVFSYVKWQQIKGLVPYNSVRHNWQVDWVGHPYGPVKIQFNGYMPDCVKKGLDPRFGPDSEDEWE